MQRTLVSAIIAGFAIILAGVTCGETYRVSDLQTLAEILDATARPGDVVELQPVQYLEAIRVVTANARSGSDVEPSPAWLEALEEIERATPAYVPVRKGHGYQPRAASQPLNIGAYQ